jgi:hypothetical protein
MAKDIYQAMSLDEKTFTRMSGFKKYFLTV